jgi:hypothetical protein
MHALHGAARAAAQPMPTQLCIEAAPHFGGDSPLLGMWAVVQSYKHMHACLLVAMPNPPLQSPATTTRSRGRLCELHSTRDMWPHIGGGTGALVQYCKDQNLQHWNVGLQRSYPRPA